MNIISLQAAATDQAVPALQVKIISNALYEVILLILSWEVNCHNAKMLLSGTAV